MSTLHPQPGDCLSPTGLSLDQWTDAYINVLLRSVTSDMGLQIAQTHQQLEKTKPECLKAHVKAETSLGKDEKNFQIWQAHKDKRIRVKVLLSEEEMVSRYVEGVIADSVAIVQSQEDEFIHDLVWDTLHCASRDFMHEKDFRVDEHNNDLFNREFVKKELELALADVKTEVSGSERTSCIVPDKTSCLRSRSSDGQSKPKVVVKAKKATKPKNDEPKFDFIYIRNRLRATLGKDSDRALTRYVLNNVPARGTWSEQFNAVDEAIERIVKEFKSGHPLVTECYDPALVEKATGTGKGDVSVEEKPTELATPTEPATPAESPATEAPAPSVTKKMTSTPSFSRTRRFINRVRQSLFSFGSRK